MWRGGSQSLGGLLYTEENVVAPDALCFADAPASGAVPFCSVGGRASSGLGPCESEPLRLPSGTTISAISRRRLECNGGWNSRPEDVGRRCRGDSQEVQTPVCCEVWEESAMNVWYFLLNSG